MKRRYVCVDHIESKVDYKITCGLGKLSPDFKAGMRAVIEMMRDKNDANFMMIEYPYDKASEETAFIDACLSDVAGFKR